MNQPFKIDLATAQRIDALCDEFEAALQGQQGRIEDYLDAFVGPSRGELLRCLLLIEMELTSPDADALRSYQARFPGYEETIMVVFREAGLLGDEARSESNGREQVETLSFSGNSLDTAATAEKEGQAPSLPEKIGRFEIRESLGQGAFGTVYRSYDPELDREVALKIPRLDRLQSADDVERFLREARAASCMRHPNICPVYEVGHVSDQYFIVMAFIHGKPLANVVKKGRRTRQRDAAKLVRKIALALAEAHAHGIVHRDLKPANIMIDGRGEPVITDFGLAKRADGETVEQQLTQVGDILGTPAYMSPEQARGDLDKIGPASDIYSLGVLLYELLTGKRPFDGKVVEVLADVLHRQPEPPSKCHPAIDRRLEAICLKAMAKGIEQRYSSMQEIADELTEFLRDEPASPPRLPQPGQAAQPASADLSSSGTASPSTTDVAIKHVVAGPRNRRWSSRSVYWLAAVSFVGFISAAVYGVVLLVVTDHGTIKIEILDPSLSVTIEGEEITITDGSEIEGKPVRVRIGKHRLIVERNGLIADSHAFTINKGTNPVLRVGWVDERVAVLTSGQRLPRKSRAQTPATPQPALPPDRSPEEIAARRQAYLDRYFPQRQQRAENATASKYAESFPPHAETRFDLSTIGMTTKLYSDWECNRPMDEARVRAGDVNYFKGYYDERGLLRQVEAYGEDGGLKDGNFGCSIARNWYDDEERLIQEAFLGTDGRPSENRFLVIAAHHAFDTDDSNAETRFFNQRGEPAEDYLGVHRRVYRTGGEPLEYRLDGQPRERWLPALNLGKRINGEGAWHAALTPDGGELYFAINSLTDYDRHGFVKSVWRRDRWSTPEPVLVDGKHLTGARPAISGDGTLMAFVAWKVNPYPGYGDAGAGELPDLKNYGEADIYVTENKNGTWGTVRNAGPRINGFNEEGGVAFVPGTHDLCFNFGSESNGLWLAQRQGDEWGDPRPMGLGPAISPVFSPDGRRIYFGTTRKGSLGGSDIWMSEKDDDNSWSRPINVGPQINHEWHDDNPTVSPGGDVMYFSSCCPWGLLVSGRANSEEAIRHMADIYALGESEASPRGD